MIVCKYFTLFIIYSFMGWIYETIYSTIVHHKFQSRGFLYGPIIPIYGLGGVLASIIFFELPIPALKHVTNLAIFTICFIGSIFLEYITSWLLEHFFHARWWDYSHSFLNINGRICFFASCGFGVAGIVIVNWLIPRMNNVTHGIHPIVIEIISLIFMLLFGMDLAVTISALTNFENNLQLISDNFVEKMTIAYDNLEKNISEKKTAITSSGNEFLEEHEKIAKAVGKISDAKDAISDTITEKKDAINDSFTDKKDAISESFSGKKEDISESITDKEVDRYIASTSWLQRRALRNIKFMTYKGKKKDISERTLFKIRNKNK